MDNFNELNSNIIQSNMPEHLSYENNEKLRPLRVVSLFSGCGGMDLGFVGGFNYRHYKFPKTNFKLVFSNDFDADAARVYKANIDYFGKHPFSEKDVTTLNPEEIPAFDILLAGFPCQPFSNAGNRKGIHDDNGRGTLFYECERIIKSCSEKSGGRLPMAFVFENVRGIMSSKMPDGRSVTEEITERMSALGFKITSKLIKASDYGVPQNRYRFLIIGVRNDIKEFDFAELDNIVEEYNLPSNKGSSYDLTLGSILSDIPESSTGFSEYWKYSPSGQKMIEAVGLCQDGKEALSKFKKKIDLDNISPTIKKGRSWKNIPPEDLAPRFKKIYDDPKKYHAPNFYRRFALGEVPGTITASAQPENCGITHPFENRRMTIREIARIQSFPDGFNFPHTSISGAYKVIGNAVPPILGWVIARALEEHLRKYGYQ